MKNRRTISKEKDEEFDMDKEYKSDLKNALATMRQITKDLVKARDAFKSLKARNKSNPIGEILLAYAKDIDEAIELVEPDLFEEFLK